MMKTQTHAIQRYLSHLSDTLRPLTDRQLIDHFAEHKDEGSFGLLLERFGPLVMGVCRRVLGNRPEAEDAFQATFLILTQQIQSLRNRDSLASWLYRVAYHAALKASSSKKRMESLPQEVSIASEPFQNATWNEIRGLLDEELNRLPERFRVPLILCYFDGATCDEGAKQLHWSLRTFKRRLDEGRKRLHVALTRRGLSGLVLGIATLPADGLRAEVSRSLLNSTCELLSSPNVKPQPIELAPLSSLVIGSQVSATVKSFTFLALSFGMVLTSFWFSDVEAQPKKSEPTKPDLVEQAKNLPEKEPFQFGSKAFRHSEGSILDIVLSPDKKFLASCSHRKVVVWDLENGKPKWEFIDPKICDSFGMFDPLQLIHFSPDSRYLAQVSRQSPGVRLWDLKTGKESQFIQDDAKPLQGKFDLLPMTNLRFLDEDRLLIWGDRNARIWSLKEKKALIRYPVDGQVFAVAPDGKEMLILKHDLKNKYSSLSQYEPLSGKIIARQHHPDNPSRYRATYSPDGKQIVSTDVTQKIFIWDRKTLQLENSFAIPKAEGQDRTLCSDICFSHDGQKLFLALFNPKGIWSYDLKTRQTELIQTAHSKSIWRLNSSSDGKMLISASWDQTIRRFDLEKKKEIPFPEGYIGQVRSASSPESKRVCIADGSGRIDLWNRSGSRILRTLQTEGKACEWLAFSKEGTRLASIDDSGEVKIWDSSTGKELKKWKVSGYLQGRSMVAFLSDPSQLILPVHSDQSRLAHLQLWDWKKEKALWEKAIPISAPGILSLDGSLLLTTTEDQFCTIHDAKTGKEVRKIQVLDRVGVIAYGAAYQAAAFSPNNRILAIRPWEGPIQLWDLYNGQMIGKWDQPEIGPGIHFSFDGDWLWSFDEERRVYLWDVRSGKEVARTKRACSIPLHGELNRLEDQIGLHQLFANEPLPRMNLETAWEQLQSDDPVKGFQAIRVFAEDPQGAIFLRKKILPAKSEDHEAIKKWIAQLDSDRFTVRESALKKLSEKGKSAIPVFEEVLKGKLTPGTQEQLNKLLETARGKRSPEETRLRRAVESMNWSASADAIQALEEWAKGSPGEPLTKDAMEALKVVRNRVSIEK